MDDADYPASWASWKPEQDAGGESTSNTW